MKLHSTDLEKLAEGLEEIGAAVGALLADGVTVIPAAVVMAWRGEFDMGPVINGLVATFDRDSGEYLLELPAIQVGEPESEGPECPDEDEYWFDGYGA